MLEEKKKINLNVITLKQLAKVKLKMLLKNYLRWRTLECGVSVVFLFLREREYINLYLHIHLVNFCNTYMISLSPFYVHIYEHMKIKGAKKGIHVGKIDIHNP